MAENGKRTVDITPDKSLLEKLGYVGFKQEEAIAEFVDNALDAKFDELSGRELTPGRVRVEVKLKSDSIEIHDDSSGILDFDNCMRAAWSEKTSGKTLGTFGLGLKTASMSLGRIITIESKRMGEKIGHRTKLNLDEWYTDPKWEIVVEDFSSGEEAHYTRIRIDDPNVIPLSYEDDLVGDLADRFGPFIIDNSLELLVNDRHVKPEELEFLPDNDLALIKSVDALGIRGFEKRRNFTFAIGGMEIEGWVDILSKRSMSGRFGFNLYRGRRLIEPFVKIGIRDHPSHSNIFGNVYLPVAFPVSFTKNKIEVQREVYTSLRSEMDDVCSDHRKISQHMAQEKIPLVSPKVDIDVKKSITALTESLKDSKLLKDIFPEEERRRVLEEESVGKGPVDSEIRAPRLNKSSTRPIPKHVRARNPAPEKPKQKKNFWYVNIGGSRIKLIHEWTETDEQKMWYSTYDDTKKPAELVVMTNTGFDSYQLTTDKMFYATSNVIMALAKVVMSVADPQRLRGLDLIDISEDLYRSWARRIKKGIEEAK